MKSKLLFLLLFVSFLPFACMKRQILQIQSDTYFLKNKLNSTSKKLLEDNEQLKKQIEQLNVKVNNLASAIADINAKQDIIDTNINTIIGKLDELNYKITTMKSRAISPPYTFSKEQSSFTITKKTIPAKTPTPEISMSQEELNRIYQSAYKNFIKGNYEIAISEFEKYLKLSPQSELSDNAQYWIGESYYTQGKYSQALEAFNKVITNYPDADKVPSALLKIGYCYLEMRKINEAINAFQNLINSFPDSEESKIAKEQIKSLKNL